MYDLFIDNKKEFWKIVFDSCSQSEISDDIVFNLFKTLYKYNYFKH